MTTNYPDDCKRLKLGLPPCTAHYAAIFEKKETYPGTGDLKFFATFAIPKDVAANHPKWKAFLAARDHYAAKHFTESERDSDRFSEGFTDGDKPTGAKQTIREEFKGCWVVKAKSSFQPDVLNRNREDFPAEDRERVGFGFGCIPVVTLHHYKMAGGALGFGCYLQLVMITDTGVNASAASEIDDSDLPADEGIL